jgi:hypothetical protein
MNLEEGEILQRLEMPMGETNSREIELYLYANQKLWIVPDDAAVVIRYRKPDGTMGEYDTLPDGSAAWSAYNNLLTLAVAPQVLTAAGTVILYAALYQEEKMLQTFAVEILVKAPFEKGRISRAVASEDYFRVTNVLRGPVMAQAGQVLAVANVDANGRVSAVEALDAATLINEKGNAVLYTAQTLTANKKYQARANIDAASQAEVDFLASKFTSRGIALVDERTGETYVIYVRNGKLMMEKE